MADETRPLPVRLLAWVLRFGALVALVSLVIEFGFPISELDRQFFHRIDLGVAALFVLDVLARLTAARDRRAHARSHWLELCFVLLLAAQAALVYGLTGGGALARVTIVAVQIYLLATVALRFIRANEKLTSKAVRPGVVLVGSFLLLIGVGTGLFLLPNCRPAGVRPWGFVDALFTATSASCVTGLNVRDVGSELSFKGQAVLLGLIQIGGLGVVTLAMFVTYLQARSFGVRQMTMVRDLLSIEVLGDLGRFLRATLLVTAVAELAGAGLLFAACREPLGIADRAWWAVFHSVSAFCNAGFGLQSDGLIRYSDSTLASLTITGLVVVGGLGFPVILNLLAFKVEGLPVFRRLRWTPGRLDATPDTRLSLHTKLVVVMTLLLLAAGAGLFYLAERQACLAGRGAGEQVLVCVFQSAMPRTAGFNTVDTSTLRMTTMMLLIVLMVIGASPASTGGGVKTSTVATLWLTLRSMLRNRIRVEAFGRTVPRRVINASIVVMVLYTAWLLITTALLVITQPEMPFLNVFFESASALSTVGLTCGVTAMTDDVGRIILSVAMLVGRVGPLTILWSVIAQPSELKYEFPEDKVLIS